MTLTAPTHTLERRMFATEFRDVPGSDGRQRWATAVTYNRPDDFRTIWLPGCFNAGLTERMPTILYGHDWYDLSHVLGQGVDFRDGPDGVDVLIEFADPEQVPSSRLAMALTANPNPILRDVSVGFDRQEWRTKDQLTPEQLALGGEEAMQRAIMDELSIVVRGAVPGASLRGRRSWVIDGTVTETDPAEPDAPEATDVLVPLDVLVLARQVNRGEVELPDARLAVSLLTEARQMPMTGMMPDAMTALSDADAAVDAALSCCEDMTGWPTEAVQMAAYCTAADSAMDDLMAALGITDPDETGQAAAVAPEPRVAEDEVERAEAEQRDADDAELASLVRRAQQRSH